jgi:hypothetical protein
MGEKELKGASYILNIADRLPGLLRPHLGCETYYPTGNLSIFSDKVWQGPNRPR